VNPTSAFAVPQRTALIVGAAMLSVAMFAAGYWLGGEPRSSELPSPHLDSRPANAEQPAGRLEDLLPALEAKVAASPRDHDQRLLLARTYAEVGQRDKAIQALRAVRKDAPQNHEAVILLATALMDGARENEWREAYRLFDDAVRLKPAVTPMARLYQGELSIKLGDRRAAKRVWTDYLRSAPADDPRRAMFEQRIAELGMK
jgi:cytochrome c-type biogenesis protein CcmH/NrfG